MVIDVYIFHFINGFAGRWMPLDYLGIFFARYFEYVLLLSLLISLAVNFKRYWRMVVEALVASVFVRFILVSFFYWLHFRARPFVNNDVNLLVAYDSAKTALPSGHASFYFALSTIIYAYNKKAGILFYVGSFMIVLGRVFVGIHWPSDILAGGVLGVVMGLVLNALFKKINLLKNEN